MNNVMNISETLTFLKTTATNDNIRAMLPQGNYNGLLMYFEYDLATASDTSKSEFTQVVSVYKNGKPIANIKISDLLAINNYKYGYPSMSGNSDTHYCYAFLDTPIEVRDTDSAYFTITGIPEGNSSNVNDIYGVILDAPAVAQNLDYFSPSVSDKEIFLLNSVKSLYITASDESKISDIEIINSDTKNTLVSAPFSRLSATSKFFHNLENTENGCLIDFTHAQNIKVTIKVSSATTLTLVTYNNSGYINPEPPVPPKTGIQPPDTLL